MSLEQKIEFLDKIFDSVRDFDTHESKINSDSTIYQKRPKTINGKGTRNSLTHSRILITKVEEARRQF